MRRLRCAWHALHALRLVVRAAAVATGIVAVETALLIASTPRLPCAPGPVSGSAVSAKSTEASEKSSPLRTLIFGDSVACGVGCPSNDEAMAGACARSLAQCTGKRVEWDVLGVSGYTATDMRKHLTPKISSTKHYDCAIISCGVNHVLGLHSQTRYNAELTELLIKLRGVLGEHCVILVMAMPPMERFPQIAYLKPLNFIVGWMAANIGAVSREVCRANAHCLAPLGCVEWDMSAVLTLSTAKLNEMMAPDGFHPAVAACDLIAVPVAEKFIELRSS